MNLLNKRTDGFWLTILLSVLGIIYLGHALYYPGSYEGGDGIRHYLVSRYSWKHPEQFLYLWGKPFFTLLSSPFSQFGLTGIKIFNILCALLSGIIVYKVAVKMEMKLPVLAPLFLGFTPIYFYCTNSGYTELLFGLMLIVAIWRYLEKDYVFPTILISFLPFVRSEGYLLLPLFMIMLVLRRKFFLVPLLALGNIAYTIVGNFYYHDWFWLRTQNPYNGRNAEFYGHGPLLHFANAYWVIFGLPVVIFLVCGVASLIIRLVKRKEPDAPPGAEEFILIYGSFVVYFVAHSIFWWKGLFNSLGLERVMAAIIPVSAIICLRGFNLLSEYLQRVKLLETLVLSILLIGVTCYPFRRMFFPLRLDEEEKLIIRAGEWYKESGLQQKSNYIYYLHPFIAKEFNLDAFDTKKVAELWGLYPNIKEWGYSVIPDSTLILWETHYGPNDGLVPLNTIRHDPHFILIKEFNSDNPKIVLGGKPFEILVFRKISQVTEIPPASYFLFDFESPDNLENTKSITTRIAYSGTHSATLDSENEYSPSIGQPVKSITGYRSVKRVHSRFKIHADKPVDASAVLSMYVGDKQIAWQQFVFHTTGYPRSDWSTVEGDWTIDTTKMQEAELVQIYIWNQNKLNFYVDDIEITYFDQ